MDMLPARGDLATHAVGNQPPPFGDCNLYATDPVLRAAVLREAGSWLDEKMTALGAELGRAEVLEWGEEANRFPPELRSFDRYGRRLDEVRFHPAYHRLMELAMRHGIHDVAWQAHEKGGDVTPKAGGHVAHAAMLALFTQAEAGVMCPITMTYAAVPALRRDPETGGPWLGKLLGGTYDAPLAPIATKRGITVGMAMTEKQGGSDVRANETRATPIAGEGGGRAFTLRGHKWFCSAPMCDGFLTLAYTDAGLTCFLVPRVTPDGARNAIHLMRLKDKLGNRSNASSEIEYHDAYAERLGEEGRGIATIIDMVHHTRLGTIAGTLGIMRMAFTQAMHHARGRRAFQKALIDQPVMRQVLADLALDYEAAVALVLHVARRYESESQEDRAYARLAVAVAKYWLTKQVTAFTVECLECHGGAGYVEDSPMPRLYREAPLNGIWEGSGNVIALDILRTLAREPLARESFLAELERDGPAGGTDPLGAAIADLKSRLSAAPAESGARGLAERMALVLQGVLMRRTAPGAVADAFAASRLGDSGRASYGGFASPVDADAILQRYEAV